MTDSITVPAATIPDVRTIGAVSDGQLHLRTVPLGGARLSRALRGDGDAGDVQTARAWMLQCPASAAEWRARAEHVRASHATADWFALLAPADTPPALVQRIYTVLASALADTGLRDRLLAQGMTPVAGKPEEFRAYQQRESAKWGAIIRSRNIRNG